MAALGLLALVVMLAIVVYFRIVIFSEASDAGFLEILLWQLASWLPWLLVFAVAVLPFAAKAQDAVRSWNAAAHVIAAIVTATLATLWFKLISENFSPFLGLEQTRYGVFPWFFIFWFFFGLFVYWGSTSFFGLTRSPIELSTGKTGKARLVVKTGKVSEVIKPDNVMWIEAQDYYSVLHLNEKQSWIKMTMKELETSLDPDKFVRVHRSTIININFLKEILKDSPGKYTAVMSDGKKRPISRQGWRDLKKLLKTSE